MFSLAIATAHADIYKWADDQGQVHYSDAPPRGAASQKIEIPTAPPQGENAQERLKAFLEEQKKQEEAHKEEQSENRKRKW